MKCSGSKIPCVASSLPVPALVVYGRNEQVIPKAPIEKALAALPRTLPDGKGRVTVGIYDQGYHMLMRDLNGEIVLRDMVSWIENPSAPLASGADERPWTEVAGG